ncbi:MAG TPA: glutaredoxin 3 [Dongiaceae bacterium]|nr:glutaredoxin 3 [Dongiaceae bacterium]
MVKVEIYTSMLCGYCHRAKRLLVERGATVTEIDVMLHPSRRKEMTARTSGRSTLPQIFIDGVHIGGGEDLAALDRAGKLAPLLGGPA